MSKTYEIDGKTYQQKPLTMGQVKRLIVHFGADLGGGLGLSDISGLVLKIAEGNAGSTFFQIILNAPELDVDNVEGGAELFLGEVLPDFFDLNEKLTKKLLDGLKSLTSSISQQAAKTKQVKG